MPTSLFSAGAREYRHFWAYGTREPDARRDRILADVREPVLLCAEARGGDLRILAMLLPFFTFADQFVAEGRMYGDELGAAGLAFLCWQGATEDRHRVASLIGLALSVAALVSLHYYALYVVAAIALAELTRVTGDHGKFDWPIWASLLGGSSVLIAYLPLIRAVGAIQGLGSTDMSELVTAYTGLVGPGCLIILVAAAALAFRWAGHDGHPDERESCGLPFHEWVACVYLLLMPIVVYVVSLFYTNAYAPRYVSPAVIGCSAAASIAVGKAGGRFRRFPGIVLGAAIFLFISAEFWQFCAAKLFCGPSEWVRRNVWVPVPGDLPVVIDDCFKFSQVAHYGTPDMKARSYFLNDADYALRNAGVNSVSRSMEVISKIAPLHIVPYREFIQHHDTFLLVKYSNTVVERWAAKHLIEDGAVLKLIELRDPGGWRGEETATYLVHMPRSPRVSIASGPMGAN